jgi:hypothetical protein
MREGSGGALSSSISPSRINPEYDFPNVFERFIRRKQLHKRPGPYVPVESRKRIRVEIAYAA